MARQGATITAEGLAEAELYFERAPERATQAARMAINDTARGPALKHFRFAIYKQVDFPQGYIDKTKLYVSQPATNSNLEARITGRQRPTSLARFLEGRPRFGVAGVKVSVHPGSTKEMKTAFPVRLRAGKSLTEDNYNVGLAIRLKPGERVLNKKQSVQLGHNLHLLYGPSIDQVFRDVAADEGPQILDMVEAEFFRQFTRLSDG